MAIQAAKPGYGLEPELGGLVSTSNSQFGLKPHHSGMNFRLHYPKIKSTAMGLTYTNLQLTNLFNRQKLNIRALVDTEATFMCVTEEVALQLGFDTSEVSSRPKVF